jgi:hypothetical protein
MTLDTLTELLVEKRKNHLNLLKSNVLISNTLSIYDDIFDTINELKKNEKEKSRIDFKNGYLKSVYNFADAFGIKEGEFVPTSSELQIIDNLSLEYITT